MIPEENRVFDPELLITEVITYTHYMPEEWKGQLHSKKASNVHPVTARGLIGVILLGPPRIRRALRDEGLNFRAGAGVSCAYAVRAMVLVAELCAGNH